MEKENNCWDTVKVLPDLIGSFIIHVLLVIKDISEESGSEHDVSCSSDDMQSASEIENESELDLVVPM
jgi:hypothetical protein